MAAEPLRENILELFQYLLEAISKIILTDLGMQFL
jgi:hypothetical protein